MAYTKTNWIDDVTPLSATNMNNIEQGIFDLVPVLTAGNIVLFKCLDEISNEGTSAGWSTLALTAGVGSEGTLRFKFSLKTPSTGVTAYGRIYRNGSAVGTLRSTNSVSYVSYTQDISGWQAGDELKLSVWSSLASNYAKVTDFTVGAGNYPYVG